MTGAFAIACALFKSPTAFCAANSVRAMLARLYPAFGGISGNLGRLALG